MKKQSKPKPKMGRPQKAGARRYSIRITDDVAEFYRAAGGGNLTRGIEVVARGGK